MRFPPTRPVALTSLLMSVMLAMHVWQMIAHPFPPIADQNQQIFVLHPGGAVARGQDSAMGMVEEDDDELVEMAEDVTKANTVRAPAPRPCPRTSPVPRLRPHLVKHSRRSRIHLG